MTTLDQATMELVASDCAAALGLRPIELVGQSVLASIRAAERAGATIYWGRLPAVAVLRKSVFWWTPAFGEV